MHHTYISCVRTEKERHVPLFPHSAFPFVPSVFLDAVLSCEFKTEIDQKPRIEWKKKDKEVSFVYFEGSFTGD